MERSGRELGYIYDNGTAWLQRGMEWRVRHRNRVECSHCDALMLCGGGCDAVMSVCGENECEIIRKNCEVATTIYRHFQSSPIKLLALAGVT
jgi:radical SAM protein with 4Fe4S-binding SPASM domain